MTTNPAPPSDVPLLLLHGFLGCKDDWHEVATSLQTGRRVAAFDLPGHGQAADAREDGDCSMDATAHRIEAVLEALEAPQGHLIGHSLGARAALYFAATRPGCVASLVLESASAGLPDGAGRDAQRRADEERMRTLLSRGLEAFVDEWETLALLATQKTLPADVLAAQRARRLRGDGEAIARSLRDAGAAAHPWLGEHLAKIDAPVLLIAGARDSEHVALARELKHGLPHAHLEIVPGAGHDVHLEKPQEFVAIVDEFLGHHAGAHHH
ncbi:MAG TPA: 2-succinyl-6-hydroxy-2,4-cyclohexadiene-1-carboxylate synthase [Candidatus Binatia bacterium]|jgi:2-succinyl-6-hydroxy-2,4-cyclohexadiene-1-carboxylate synthase